MSAKLKYSQTLCESIRINVENQKNKITTKKLKGKFKIPIYKIQYRKFHSNSISNRKLPHSFYTGLRDAEGCFTIKICPRIGSKIGWVVKHPFQYCYILRT